MSYICQVSNFSQFSSCQTFPMPVKNFSTQIAQEASRCTLSSSKPSSGKIKKSSINNLKRNFPWKQWGNLFEWENIQRYNTNNRRIETFIRIPPSLDRSSRIFFPRNFHRWNLERRIEDWERKPWAMRQLYRKRVEDLAEAGAEPLLCANERVRSVRETRPNWSSKQKRCCTMLSIRQLRRQRDNNHAGLKMSLRVRCHVQWYEIWIRTIRPT